MGVRVAVTVGERDGVAGAAEVAGVVRDRDATAFVVVAVGQGVGDGGGVGGVQETRAQIKLTRINNRCGEQLAMAPV